MQKERTKFLERAYPVHKNFPRTALKLYVINWYSSSLHTWNNLSIAAYKSFKKTPVLLWCKCIVIRDTVWWRNGTKEDSVDMCLYWMIWVDFVLVKIFLWLLALMSVDWSPFADYLSFYTRCTAYKCWFIISYHSVLIFSWAVSIICEINFHVAVMSWVCFTLFVNWLLERIVMTWTHISGMEINNHIKAETKWPPFRRRHCQMHCFEWKYKSFD